MMTFFRAIAVAAILLLGHVASASAAATDNFSTYTTALDSPLIHGAVVSPSDSVDLANVSRACLVGIGGDIKVDTAGGETALVIPNVPVGWHPFRLKRIYVTGTTADKISCWW